ncbi:MAG TPA: polysaccharide biosynthesis protein [Pyrinomonadaceae bacterium]|nr:polysaccharide biosynthesis protein [Pyrinomonadaceae bacterium]HMP64924.1 polysaccharide biosynthesis protein [Pyrinomonadaceae bacterium]
MEKLRTLEGKRVLVTGGTGSLGQTLVKRLLGGTGGLPERVTVFSRDEAKQHYMRLEFLHQNAATDDIIYTNSQDRLSFQIGDVRDRSTLVSALKDIDVVFHAAALKQVPSCEYFPFEAVKTNILGAQNLVSAICESDLPIETVIGISTDKACKPINVMGMTKALQERILIEANRERANTRFLCVRYGNVIASRGSIIPLFVEQLRQGRPLTVTLPEMTRFLLSLERAVDTVIAAYAEGIRGETYVPKVKAARIEDVARALAGDDDPPIEYSGIRPGEKIHEIMVSEEECFRTIERGDHYVILPVLPELRPSDPIEPVLSSEYSSKDNNISVGEIKELIKEGSGEIANFIAAKN